MPTLRLLTTGTGASGHADEVSTCSFSPDNQFVLSGGWDGFLRLWDCLQGAPVAALRVSDKAVSACAVSPDGQQWLSGTLDGLLTHWDAGTQKQHSTFLAHARPISAILFGRGESKLATASWDCNLILWNLPFEREGQSLNGHKDIVAGCRFTPDGQALLSWSYDGTLRLWELGPARPLGVVGQHGDRILSATVSPDGRWAAAGARDAVLKLWDLHARREVLARTLEAEIRGCFFLLDAAYLVTAEATGKLRLFSVPDLKEQTGLDTQVPIQCGDLAPSGAQIALGGADGMIHFVAVDGFDQAPLVVTATRTSRRTATALERLFGKSRMVPAYSCTCPACRQSFELTGNTLTSQTLCPGCRRQLRLHSGERGVPTP